MTTVDSGYILLFAHPRSGSSNLYQILQLHPRLNLLEEPFNENFVNWEAGNKDYRATIRDEVSLRKALAEIGGEFDGLKVLNYQLDDGLTAVLLQNASRVLFLRRQNILQSVVSNLIALQTNLWKKWEMRGDLATHYANLQPLNPDDVKARVQTMATHLAWCEQQVDRLEGQRVFKLIYERFYFAPEEAQRARLREVWQFLGVEPLQHPDLSYYLRPRQSKLNSADTYRLIPNAEEVNARCGSEATGWLF